MLRIGIDIRIAAGTVRCGVTHCDGQHTSVRCRGGETGCRCVQPALRQVLRPVKGLLGPQRPQQSENHPKLRIVQRKIRLIFPVPRALRIQCEGEVRAAIIVCQIHIVTLGQLRRFRHGGLSVRFRTGLPVANAQHDQHCGKQHGKDNAQHRNEPFFFPSHRGLLIVVKRRKRGSHLILI